VKVRTGGRKKKFSASVPATEITSATHNGAVVAVTHHYQQNGVYVVTATAKLQDGSTRAAGRVEILVSSL